MLILISTKLLAHRAKYCDPNIGSETPQTAIAIQIIWGAGPRSPQSRFQILGGATPRSTQCVQKTFSTTGPSNSPRRSSAAVGLRPPSAFAGRRPAAAVGLRLAVGLRPLSACGRSRPSPAVTRQKNHHDLSFDATITNSLNRNVANHKIYEGPRNAQLASIISRECNRNRNVFPNIFLSQESQAQSRGQTC